MAVAALRTRLWPVPRPQHGEGGGTGVRGGDRQQCGGQVAACLGLGEDRRGKHDRREGYGQVRGAKLDREGTRTVPCTQPGVVRCKWVSRMRQDAY